MLRKLNFKAIFCLFVLVLPLTLSGLGIRAEEQNASAVPAKEKIKIAAWNIKYFGYGGQYKRTEEELEQIAEILSKYDLIAITELMENTTQFDRTLEKLSDAGQKYCALISEPIGWETGSEERRRYKERYAFLYREGLINLVDKGDFYPDMDDKEDDFARNPYWATFCAGDFDFTVIVVHTHAGNMKSDPQREYKKLDSVFQHVQNKNGEDEKDILLVGDFNTKRSSRMGPDKKFSHDFLNNILKTLEHEATPLFRFEDGDLSNIINTELYDNIFFQKNYLTEYACRYGIFRFDDDVYEGNDSKAKRISDHRPVWAEFRIDLKDDD